MQLFLQAGTRVPPTIKSLRLILVALIAGLVLFAIGVYVIHVRSRSSTGSIDDGVGNRVELAKLLVLIAGGMLATGIAVALVIRVKVTQKLASSKEEALALIRADRVPPSLSSAIIVSAALVEGPGLLGGVAYIVGAPDYALALPIVAAAVIAWMIPSRESLEQSLI